MTKKSKDKTDIFDPPGHEIEALARCILPSIQKFFESEEGKREFEEWKKQKDKKKQTENIDSAK